MLRHWQRLACGLIMLFGLALPAMAQSGTKVADQDAVVASAKAFLDLMREGKFNTIWKERVSQYTKQRGSQDLFVANLSKGRNDVGVLQKTKLVDLTYYTKDVASGYVGDIYQVRFLNTYERGKYFQALILIREADGQWRVSGLNEYPAPAD